MSAMKPVVTEIREERGDFAPLASTNGSPSSDFRAKQRAEQYAIRCLTSDEFFAAESTANLVVPALGICPGPPTGLVGQSYVGKTIVALSFGLSVALGRDLWGMWRARQGSWLHLDYEQGRRHTKSRIHRLARGFGVTDDELRALIDGHTIRIAILPDLRLTTDKASDHFKRAFEGVSFVTCDSLRPMLAGVDENSSQVRGHMSALSMASDASGAAVSLIHHGGKTPLEGERPRKETPRGSSGIVDEFQSLFVMTKNKGDEFTHVTHEKDRELGEPVADFGLRVEDVPTDDGNPKGGLRVAHVDRDQMNGKAEGSGDVQFVRALKRVSECIGANPGIAGADAVTERTKMQRKAVGAAVRQLVADGHVVSRPAPGPGPGNGVRLYLAHAAPAEGK
jgi:hypothetical protein